MEQVLKIAEFVVDSFIHIWPYLLFTIPLAVVVQLSGASRFIHRAFSRNPLMSVLLATFLGAFSPFCSCGVIPVIASLLIGGVPLGPVMSFWIASPSMDPEIFFISAATVGWNMTLWRLAATFVISLSSGYITHLAFQRGWLGSEILRKNSHSNRIGGKTGWGVFIRQMRSLFSSKTIPAGKSVRYMQLTLIEANTGAPCCVPVNAPVASKLIEPETGGCDACCSPETSFQKRMLTETWKAVFMVAKFMTLAFLINALIQFYVPQEFITGLLGGKGTSTVLLAALTGVPVYTSNLTALPLIGGLLAAGMNPGAALAFLISGPVTTLPAMVAVWGIVRKKIFVLYIAFILIGAVLFGLLFNLFALST